MLLKLKIDEVIIKGIGFADGRKQRIWVSKEDTSSTIQQPRRDGLPEKLI